MVFWCAAGDTNLVDADGEAEAGKDREAEADVDERQTENESEGSAQDEVEEDSVTVRLAPANGGGAGTKDKYACNFTAGTLSSAVSAHTAGSASGNGPDGEMTVDAHWCAVF